MKSQTTHYDVLQVARNAEAEVIKAAYESLRQAHETGRETSVGDENVILKRLQQAYAVLSDPRSRSRYDQRIALWPDSVESMPFRAMEDPALPWHARHKGFLVVLSGCLSLAILISVYLQLLASALESYLIAGPLLSPQMLAAVGIFLMVIELGIRLYQGLVTARHPRAQAVRIFCETVAVSAKSPAPQGQFLLAA